MLLKQMSVSKLIHYFSSYPAAFGLQASSPPDNMTLNNMTKKTNLRLSDFQTGVGAAAHATLDTEQLISHTRATFVDTIGYLYGSDLGVIQFWEVHKLLRFMTL